MEKYFYIDSQGNQRGPCDIETLKVRGITPSTKIWKRGAPGGMYVEAQRLLPELFNAKGSSRNGQSRRNEQHIGAKPHGTSEQRLYFDKDGKLHNTSAEERQDSSSFSQESTIHRQSGNNPSESEVDIKKWKMYAIVQLVCTFTVFLILAIIFEILASAAMEVKTDFMYEIETAHYSGMGVVVLVIYWIAWFIAKFWPLFAILGAGICSLISINKKNLRDIRYYTLISFGICIGMVILGIISCFYPFTAFIILIIGLGIGLICSWLESGKD